MPFARIEHLDDVLPHIGFDKGFAVSRRGDHTVVDYVFTVDGMFDSAVALECRGLKFDRDGRIIGRPLHKFFNLGERQRVEDIDWTAPHRVLAKLDGSMIHPVLLDGAMLFMTRMGATDQARHARSIADQGVLDLCRFVLEAGITPIFEFTSPANRIVIRYDEPQLTLLAARHMLSGDYLSHAELEGLGRRFAVPIVADGGPVVDAKAFVGKARQEAGIEGYVVAFDDGHRIKLKTEGYVLRHRALGGVQLEKNVLAMVVTEAVDDVVPLLADDLATRLLDYRTAVNGSIAAHAGRINDFVEENRTLPRKDFAARAFAQFDRRLTGAVFAALDGHDPVAALKIYLASAAQSDPKVEAARDLFGMKWSLEGLDLPELEA